MYLLTLRSLSKNPGRSALVILAIALGVSMALAGAIVGEAITQSAAEIAEQGVSGNTFLALAALAVVSLMLLSTAGFVITNAFAMAVTRRRRELAALRALGMTRRQTLRGILAEAVFMGASGSLLGVLFGIGLAWVALRFMGLLDEVAFSVPGWGLILSPLAGMAVTLSAALFPALSASRLAPLEAARSASTAEEPWFIRAGWKPGAALLGLAIGGELVYGLVFRPSIYPAQAGFLLGQGILLAGAFLSLPSLIALFAKISRPFMVRRLGLAGRLAADNLARNQRRAALTAGALTAGLTLIAATSGLTTAGLKGALNRTGKLLGEATFVVPDIDILVAEGEMTLENFFQVIGDENLASDNMNPALTALEQLEAEGVILIERNRFFAIPSEISALPGAPGIFVDLELFLQLGNFNFFEGDPETALSLAQAGPVLLTQPVVADRLGLQVGDAFSVQTPRGEVTFTVAGIGGSGYLMTVIPYSVGEEYFGITAPSHIGILLPEGQDEEAALAQVKAAIAPFPFLTTVTGEESFKSLNAMVERMERLIQSLMLLAVVVAALGVVNSVTVNVVERRRELALLRAVGASQRDVRRAVVAETALLGFLAALVAGGLGLLMLLGFAALILPNATASVGVPPDWETIRLTLGGGLQDWAVSAGVVLVVGPLVAGLAAYFPARRAAGRNVVEVTRSERVGL